MKLDRAYYRLLDEPEPLEFTICFNPMSGYPSAVAVMIDSNIKTGKDGRLWRVSLPGHRDFTLCKESKTFKILPALEMIKNTFLSVEEAALFIESIMKRE